MFVSCVLYLGYCEGIMLKILEKYNRLPQAIRDRMSSDSVLSAVKELEAKYKINLHVIIMRIMVGEISINSLVEFFTKEFKIDLPQAQILSKELKGIIEKKQVETRFIASPVAASPVNNLDAFSQEDEKEIEQINQSMDQVKIDPNSNIDDKANKIFDQLGISFSSQFLLDRFKKILKVNLSGVRDLDATSEILLKPFDQGGVKLSEDDAKRTIDTLGKVKLQDKDIEKSQILKSQNTAKSKNEISKQVEIARQPAQSGIARDVEYNLEKEIAKTQNSKPRPPAQSSVASPPAEKLVGVVKTQKSVQDNVTIKDEKKEVEKVEKVQEKIADKEVKHKPRTMSPIDELRYLSLVDFRRLHEDPAKAIIKIQEKINLLGGYKYNDKVEGMQAWRESPVNKMYLKIGHSSMVSGKSVKDTIYELGEKDSLNQEEFDIIGKLNYELRTSAQ